MRFRPLVILSFTSDGPTSFGPNEQWSYLFVMDGTNINDDGSFKIYRISLKNTDDTWMNIKVNKKETIKDHCAQKKDRTINLQRSYRRIGLEIHQILEHY